MEDDLVQIYEMIMSFDEFNEYVESLKREGAYLDNSNITFPINKLLADNNIISFNKIEMANAQSVISNVVRDLSPSNCVIIKVYVYKTFELSALDILNSQEEYEEPEELKGYEPIVEEE